MLPVGSSRSSAAAARASVAVRSTRDSHSSLTVSCGSACLSTHAVLSHSARKTALENSAASRGAALAPRQPLVANEDLRQRLLEHDRRAVPLRAKDRTGDAARQAL